MTYGTDTWCTDHYVPGRLARGAQVVAQALYRMTITVPGTLRGGEDDVEERE